MQNAIDHEHRYVGTPYIFGGTARYRAGKRSSGRVDYSYIPFVKTPYIEGIGYVSREEYIDHLILHEANHYGPRVDRYDPYTYKGTQGPRGLAANKKDGRHEPNYYIKVNQDFLRIHPICAF